MSNCYYCAAQRGGCPECNSPRESVAEFGTFSHNFTFTKEPQFSMGDMANRVSQYWKDRMNQMLLANLTIAFDPIENYSLPSVITEPCPKTNLL